MRKREVLILKWLQGNPGWHSYREIGIKALHLDPMRKWSDMAIIGHLKRLKVMGKVEFGKGKLPGILEAYRAKEA